MSLKGLLKIFILGVLGIGLSIGLANVLETVSERSSRRDKVYEEMAQTTAGEQVIAGPFLALDRDHFVLPKTLRIDGKLKTEQRYRSLYEILLFESHIQLKGEFDIPKDWILQPGSSFQKPKPFLVILVEDSRGIVTVPLIKGKDRALEVRPGFQSMRTGMNGGFHSYLADDFSPGESYPFEIEFDLKGMQSLSWVPAGLQTEARFEADWPHPSFMGRALPLHHTITDKGFVADWKVTEFSQDIAKFLIHDEKPADLKTQGIGFKLIEPIDVYRQTERSVKYGFLLIVLTFGVFLGLEVLKRLSIHPVQYAFVGIALVLFYVLLLALSEHITFALAYLSASVASISLLGFYVRYVLHSWKGALGFSYALAVLNALIYGILQAEDYAMLYGAILLFTILATAMVVTRKVNWNALASDSK